MTFSYVGGPDDNCLLIATDEVASEIDEVRILESFSWVSGVPVTVVVAAGWDINKVRDELFRRYPLDVREREMEGRI